MFIICFKKYQYWKLFDKLVGERRQKRANTVCVKSLSMLSDSSKIISETVYRCAKTSLVFPKGVLSF